MQLQNGGPGCNQLVVDSFQAGVCIGLCQLQEADASPDTVDAQLVAAQTTTSELDHAHRRSTGAPWTSECMVQL